MLSSTENRKKPPRPKLHERITPQPEVIGSCDLRFFGFSHTLTDKKKSAKSEMKPNASIPHPP